MSPQHSFFSRLKHPKVFMTATVMILIVTTTIWSYWSAGVENSNADQLVDPYLFTDWQTFHTAVFPAAHTQLLKWPLFWLIGQFGVTPDRLVAWTVLLSLVTVGGLAYLLYKIERRPRVFASICLLLSLVLLLVPPQPYAGSLLPANFAMLTTRNIEYLVFVMGLAALLRAKRLRSLGGIGSIGLLGVLFASDQLFLELSGGGAVLLLFLYALARKWQVVSLAARWLLATAWAAVFGFVCIVIINATHFTHILSTGSGVPYQVTQNISSLILAVVYGILGILMNIGANPPSAQASQLRHIAGNYLRHFASLGGLAYAVALAAAGFAGRYTYKLVRAGFKRGSNARLSVSSQLVLLLTATGLISFILFIISDHYYAVDARYLAIWLFTLMCGLAFYSRQQRWRLVRLAQIALVLGVGIISALIGGQHTAQQQAEAYTSVNSKNDLIAQALSHHHVSTLVGDYWRVLPTKLASRGTLTVTPLDNCTTPRTVLTSATWQPDLRTHSFAYLLSNQPGLTGFPACSYQTVTQAYGQPNSRIRISGSIEQPDDQLLIYDHGIKGASQLRQTPLITSPVPVSLHDLDVPRCDNATIMNVTAHEDDDLLFINPDTLHSLQAGDCIRSVYLTAGDSGLDSFYWLNRQLGIEAAYANMVKTPNVWVEQTVKLADRQYITLASLHDHPEISLIFFNLPDGGIHGTGFPVSGYQSLERLRDGQISSVTSVDTESNYTIENLINALAEIMQTYQVADVRTQANVPSETYPDHSDHIATGQFARDAAAQYSHRYFGGNINIPVQSYIGYPIHSYPENVSDSDLDAKIDAFMAYAKFDGGVCHSREECAQTPTYGSYLTRQYQE